MTEKSYVSMEQKVCPVCGIIHTHKCGILLDRRLRNSMEKYTITSYGLCEEHDKLWEDRYVALVVVKNAHNKGVLKLEEAERTGMIIHIKKDMYCQMFSVKEDVTPISFIDEQLAKELEDMSKNLKQ